MNDAEEMLIDCSNHGKKRSAIVCRHLLNEKHKRLGFIENSSIPGDYQAWCGECEELFIEEKEMTERFREFNDFAVVCESCYERIKEHHSKDEN